MSDYMEAVSAYFVETINEKEYHFAPLYPQECGNLIAKYAAEARKDLIAAMNEAGLDPASKARELAEFSRMSRCLAYINQVAVETKGMCDLVSTSLKRNHPDITAEEIASFGAVTIYKLAQKLVSLDPNAPSPKEARA